jgi:monofunctional biosynthetic peptidoglycan transglycosylase
MRRADHRSARAERGSVLGRIVLGLLALPFIVSLAWVWFVWPPPAWYRLAWPRSTAFMKLREAEAAGEAPVPRAYRPVPLSSIAPDLKNAVLVAEDHRFYEHHGIDYVELRHALGYSRDSFSLSNPRDRDALRRALFGAYEHRDRIRGASTITQQLAKNLYLSSSRSPLRKVKEAVTAWRLEYWLGKERILELYLNVAELGPGIWGAEAASLRYFRRPAKDLALPQAAMLAGTLPFPLRSNPAYRPGRMRARQALILRRLRGELAEVPRVVEVPEAPVIPIPDSVPIPVIPDTVVDTLRGRRE